MGFVVNFINLVEMLFYSDLLDAIFYYFRGSVMLRLYSTLSVLLSKKT